MIKGQKVQGDVLLTPFGGTIPKGAKKLPHRTIAEGEVTGHHHTLTDGDVWVLGEQMWVVAPEGTDLVHQEHGVISYPPDTYQVDRQIEVDPFTGIDRRVLD